MLTLQAQAEAARGLQLADWIIIVGFMASTLCVRDCTGLKVDISLEVGSVRYLGFEQFADCLDEISCPEQRLDCLYGVPIWAPAGQDGTSGKSRENA